MVTVPSAVQQQLQNRQSAIRHQYPSSTLAVGPLVPQTPEGRVCENTTAALRCTPLSFPVCTAKVRTTDA